MLRFLISPLVGACLGAVMGHFGKCSGGACPLTSTWWRGVLYGAFIGLVLALSLEGG